MSGSVLFQSLELLVLSFLFLYFYTASDHFILKLPTLFPDLIYLLYLYFLYHRVLCLFHIWFSFKKGGAQCIIILRICISLQKVPLKPLTVRWSENSLQRCFQWLFVILLVFSIFLSLARIRGEYFNEIKMFRNERKKNDENVIHYCRKAENAFYPDYT